MRLSRLPRTLILGTLAVGILGSGACYGSFNLTKKLYNYNKGVGDKWVVELVFLALVVIPVYEVAVAVDALLLNSVEFWTGENPVQLSRTTVGPDGRRYVQSAATDASGRTMVIQELAGDRILSTTVLRFDPAAASVTAESRNADGEVITRTATRLADGTVVVAQ